MAKTRQFDGLCQFGQQPNRYSAIQHTASSSRHPLRDSDQKRWGSEARALLLSRCLLQGAAHQTAEHLFGHWLNLHVPPKQRFVTISSNDKLCYVRLMRSSVTAVFCKLNVSYLPPPSFLGFLISWEAFGDTKMGARGLKHLKNAAANASCHTNATRQQFSDFLSPSFSPKRLLQHQRVYMGTSNLGGREDRKLLITKIWPWLMTLQTCMP